MARAGPGQGWPGARLAARDPTQGQTPAQRCPVSVLCGYPAQLWGPSLNPGLRWVVSKGY